MTPSPARILIIEDNPQLLEMVVVGLEEQDVRVVGAPTGRDALAWLGQQRFDTIILDLGLPGMEGTEVLRRIKNDHASANIPVIVMTGRHEMVAKLRAFELGAADYVTKPFEMVELRARVQAFLRAKRLQDELTQANQLLNAKAELLAMTSHEIRTQLGAVTALTNLLLQTDLSAQQRDYAGTIYSSGESLLKLLNDLLNISKLESGKLELEKRPFHLRLCVDEALDLLAAKCAEKNLELICDFDEGIPDQVVGDDTRLRQILFNLISNALKFTQAGEVVLGVHAGPLVATPIMEAGAEGANAPRPVWEFHFAVRDTGIGIPADRLQRLFQCFSQADNTISRQYGGSGLGLFISKGLVELMGGRIWAESIEGRGTTIHFTANLPAASLPEPEAWQRAVPELAGRRVLIVDDNATSNALLSRQMQRWGMVARTASCEPQSLAWLREGPSYDLLVIDAQLSSNSGASLASEIRKLPSYVHVPMIQLQALGGRVEAPAAIETDIRYYLTKPVRTALLHATALRALAVGVQPEVIPAAQRTPPPVQLDVNQAARVPLRILLADDNPINLKVTRKILNQFGYQPDTATNGNDVVLAVQRESYDVVLMDVQMPGLSGLEATERIRTWEKETGRLPIYIIATTAEALSGDREICLAAGMDAYLAKPVRSETLIKFLEGIGPERLAARQGIRSRGAAAPIQPNAYIPEDEPEVDMDRLTECAGGSPESLVEIIDLYLAQTGGQIQQMQRELAKQNPAEVARLAHQCAGASGLCGVNGLVPLARDLERCCKTGDFGNTAENLLERLDAVFQSVKEYLLATKHRTSPPVVVSSPQFAAAGPGVALAR